VNAGELHRLARSLREIATAATADPGERSVSAGDIAIAEDVAHHEGTSVGQVAERTGLAQSLVSKTVAAMRDAGVMVIEPDPADRRRVQISIAPAARSDLFRDRGGRPVAPALREVLPGVPKRDLKTIERLLDELAGLLRP
jgi:DNA-binding MarR family transcriptional regulator